MASAQDRILEEIERLRKELTRVQELETKRKELDKEITSKEYLRDCRERELIKELQRLDSVSVQLPIKQILTRDGNKTKEWCLDNIEGHDNIKKYINGVLDLATQHLLRLTAEGRKADINLNYGRIIVFCEKTEEEIYEEARSLQQVQKNNIGRNIKRDKDAIDKLNNEIAALKKELELLV